MTYPSVCYVKVESLNEIGVVKWGKRGYYELSKQPTETNVDALNEEIGVSKNEAKAMQILSMNDEIADDEKAWEEKFVELMAKL